MSENWFSNFNPFETPMDYQGLVYLTPENFYQAMKSKDQEYRKKIAAETPANAKKLGRTVKIRPDWESIKVSVMGFALDRKFVSGTDAFKRLIQTEGEIVEWNNWHDNIWGKCTCDKCKSIPGQNLLGKLLMIKRTYEKMNEIQKAYTEERSAIMQYDGGLTKFDADMKAIALCQPQKI